MTRKLSFVEFLGDAFLIIFSFWLFLYIGMGVFFLGFLLELSLSIHNRFYISSCCSFHAFSFFLYWKYKNTRHFILVGILIFWVFVIYLSACKERLHFYSELQNWIESFIFRKHIIHWKLNLGLCIVFIFTLLVEP